MAHVGRAYPLADSRAFNCDAPYPHWAAAEYFLRLPDATGTYGPDLSFLEVTMRNPIMIATGLFFEEVYEIPLQLAFVHIEHKIGWNNTLPHPRVITTKLWVHQIRPGLPPIDIDLAIFGLATDPDTHLDVYVAPMLFAPNPANYSTGGLVNAFPAGWPP